MKQPGGRQASAGRTGKTPAAAPEVVAAEAPDAPFWKRKSLKDMTNSEWEQLCDGCGRCCLEKLQEEDSETVHYTDIACRLFDPATCRCTDYARRARRVSGCVQLSPRNIAELHWMPVSCAYRLLAEGRDLYWWHPLVSGRAETVEEAGISVRGRVTASRREMPAEELEYHLAKWPNQVPRKARQRP